VNRSGSSNWVIDPLPLVAFLGGLVAVVVTYLVGSTVRGERSSISLVLAGVAVTSLATAVQTFLLQRNSDVVRQVYSWILGRLSTATWADVRLVIPYVVLSATVLLMHRRLLDVLRVGDEEATALGDAAASLVGESAVERNRTPVMGSEDFAYMLLQRPGAYIHVGNGDGAMPHNPRYQFNDEAIPYGAALYARVVEKGLPGA
jgi:uncharacterized membrane protein